MPEAGASVGGSGRMMPEAGEEGRRVSSRGMTMSGSEVPVIGFTLYYYVIKHMDASKVSLITLVTPVIALLLGHWLNGEVIGLRLWLGTGLILFGLTVHQWEMLSGLLRPTADGADC